jgi:hypothetical protein
VRDTGLWAILVRLKFRASGWKSLKPRFATSFTGMKCSICLSESRAPFCSVIPTPRRQNQEIRRGKAFIQIKNGPFDLDLVFAPDGIERFDDAWAVIPGLVEETTSVCSVMDRRRRAVPGAAFHRVRDMEVSDPCKVPANRKNPGVDALRQSRDRQGRAKRVTG